MAKKKIDYIEMGEDGNIVNRAQKIYDEMYKIVMDKVEKINARVEDMNPKTFSVVYDKLLSQVTTYIRNEFFKIMSKYPTLTTDEAFSLDSGELMATFQNFVELISMISNELDALFNVDKVMFCEYASLTLNEFNALLSSGNENQRAVMERIDGYIYSIKQSASEEGLLQGKQVTSGEATKHYGHSAVQASAFDGVIKTLEQQPTKATDARLAEINKMFRITKKD